LTRCGAVLARTTRSFSKAIILAACPFSWINKS
jgi:hypothetical protein